MTADVDKQTQAPFFGSEDTILVCSDGTEFHVAASQLARSSGWFRTLFTLPHKEDQQPSNTTHIVVSEDALTLEVLLNICCGTGIAPGLARLATLGDLERCLRAAEKYEMPGATEVLLLVLYKPEMQEDALHLYALADRYGLADLAAGALKRLVTMRLDFATIEHVDRQQLRHLVARRQERIERFCALLVAGADEAAPFFLENNDYCPRSAQLHESPSSDPRAWARLVVALQTAFIRHPSVEALESDERVAAEIAKLDRVSCAWYKCGLQQFQWKDIRRRLLEMMVGDEGN